MKNLILITILGLNLTACSNMGWRDVVGGIGQGMQGAGRGLQQGAAQNQQALNQRQRPVTVSQNLMGQVVTNDGKVCKPNPVSYNHELICE